MPYQTDYKRFVIETPSRWVGSKDRTFSGNP